MEIVYTDIKKEIIPSSMITGVYGDTLDLIRYGIDIKGINYDDEKTVKNLLNGYRLILNKRIPSLFSYFNLNINILKKKIKDLNKRDFKYVLLSYLILNKKKSIIFDYVEIGLNHKERKNLIKIMRDLKKDGFAIIVVSKDLVFLDSVVDKMLVLNNKEVIYNGKMHDLIKHHDDLLEDNEILSFIKMANKKGANLDVTLDNRELLKDIYRSV